MRRYRLPLVALALVAALVVLELAFGGGEEVDRAPPLPTAVLVPPQVTIESLEGKPAIVNFWASWCEPCREEAPHLQRFYERNRGRVGFVGVSYTDNEKGARRFIKRYGWTFPNLSDPDGLAGAAYRLVGLPVTVVLDPKGQIAQRLTGAQTEAKLEAAVRKAGAS